MSEKSTDAGTSDDLASRRTDPNLTTRWAADRTFWAADRAFIAWLRTAIAMIGFGVSIGKAGEALKNRGYPLDEYHGMQIVGVSLIVLAVIGLSGALFQEIEIGRRMARQGYGRTESLPLTQFMGILVLGVGIAGLLVIFI